MFTGEFTITDLQTDCFGRLKPSALLQLTQTVAGEHCRQLQLTWQDMQEKNLFWAIIRHRVRITRLPLEGETVRLETWPMPTTRTAFPRCTVAVDSRGQELFRTTALWVLMDTRTRAMVLPGKSGISLSGQLRGTEPDMPGSLLPGSFDRQTFRQVCFTDLDLNGHMNNARYLDWIQDLLPSAFHKEKQLRQMELCYLSEALEGQQLQISWQLQQPLQVEITGPEHRVFAARLDYEE